jgi:predicted N-acyltransferase
MLDSGQEVASSFFLVLAFLAQQPVAVAEPACFLGTNEIYARVRGSSMDLDTLARDESDYKAAIVRARDTAAKLVLAEKLANRRLARGVVPELDACFAALELSVCMAA